MEPSPHFSDYAAAGPLIAACLAAYNPPSRISTADFAATNRYLSNQGGGFVGLWDHDKAPYLVDLMDALDDTDHTTVLAVGPGQCGKTAVAENWLLKMVCTDPADLLWYMQTDASMQAHVKQAINPTIASHPQLRSRQGQRRTDDSLSYKGFQGMSVQFLGATHSNLVNKRAGRIVADEFDAYDIGGADPKTLLDVRRSTYGRESKLFCLSHPDRSSGPSPGDWDRGIMSLYRDSDRRIWWWPCPHCGQWSSPAPNALHQTTLEYNDQLPLDEVAASAHLLCPHNGCIIDNSERRAMNLRGRWVGLGQEIDADTGQVTGQLAARDTAGFWIVGLMSPFVFGGLGGLAAALVKAQREFDQTGDDASLRQVVVKQLGHGYKPPRQVGSVDAETLAQRADDSLVLGTVPVGVRFITCAIDVQGNRFERLYRGFGEGRESWVLRHDIIRNVSPPTDPAAWDTLMAESLAATFPLADGTGRVMQVRGVGYDSAGEAGVTSQAYDAWRRANRAGRGRAIGMIGFRRAYTLLPLKGGSAKAMKPLQIVFPDARSDRAAGSRGDVPIGLFAPNWHKDLLAAQLERAEPGPGYVHFPAGLRSQHAPHPFFEQLVAEKRDKVGQWSKVAQRNEVLDLMVMTGVIAHLFAPSRFDWARPPPWARDWATNTLVTTPDAAGAPHSVRPAPPAASVKPPPQAQPSARPLAPVSAVIAGQGRQTALQRIAALREAKESR